MAKKNKKFPLFWVLFVLFIAVMLVFWIWALSVVKKNLVIYEEKQPEHTVEKVVDKFINGTIEDSLSFTSGNRFEPVDVYKTMYLADISGKTFTYEKDATSYDTTKPVFNIYADDKKVATVTLNLVSTKNVMVILAMQEWEVLSVNPIYKAGNNEITVTIPENYSAFVNAVKLDDRDETGKTTEFSELKYAKDYVAVPVLREYHVEGLVSEPSLTVYDNNGREVEYSIKNNAVVINEYRPIDVTDEIYEMALTNAKNYSDFFSRDLAGCRDSVDPIRYMFPEDSYYLELADNYRLNDMWMYSAHQTPEYANEKVTEYTMYNPELISVRVYFEKNMILGNGTHACDVSDNVYYYVKYNDSWVIVDMRDVRNN